MQARIRKSTSAARDRRHRVSIAAAYPVENGAFLTIEGIWQADPRFGGRNFAGVELSFSTGPNRLADYVTSFQFGSVCDNTLGIGCVTGSEANAVDGDLSFGTIPRFGATNPNDPNERMQLTVGFRGISDVTASVPEPASLALLGLGLAIGAVMRRRSRQG